MSDSERVTLYLIAQALCVPKDDSVVEQPNEKMRNEWANTAYERFVYIQDDIIIGYAHIEGNCIGSITKKKGCQRLDGAI